jgi:hypothetical protein
MTYRTSSLHYSIAPFAELKGAKFRIDNYFIRWIVRQTFKPKQLAGLKGG